MKHSKLIKKRSSLKSKGVETKKVDYSTKSNEQLGVLFYIVDGSTNDYYGFHCPLEGLKFILNMHNQIYNDPLLARQGYQALIYGLIKNGVIDNRMFSGLLEQYLATFEVVKEALVKYKNQSIGIILTLNLNDKDNPSIIVTDFVKWKIQAEEVFEKHNKAYLDSLQN